jgi:cytochrome c-type biogenesis protein CcmF
VIAEIGHFALIMALVMALIQALPTLWGAWKHNNTLMSLAVPAACLQLVMLGIAFACLMLAYVVSDFSILNVASNSHTQKPLLYKISGVWGNHEGSILLWGLILAFFGAAVALFGRRLPLTFKTRVLGVQALIGVGFLSFSLFTSNPFLRLDPAPLEGLGLNPLLQDPGLAFHPPMLYLGYVGFSIAFSFAIAALLEGRVDAIWARWVRPWTLAAWCFLTAGIALGSWWAYYELGWGGWWFWDPVENASLMPWLAGTALLHSAIVVERRETLKSWTILLAIIAFSLSLLGTFIVRSGVLNSVHAFASDPARGIYILGFLTVVVGGSLFLFAFRASTLRAGGMFALVSRESGLVWNNLFLAAATGTVLFGTLFPMLADAFGYKVTVAAPYFNAVFVPLMIPLILVMAVGPMLAWKRGNLPAMLRRLWPAFATVIVGLVLTWFWQGTASPMAVVGMATGLWLLGGVAVELGGRIDLFRVSLGASLRRAMGLPRSAWGMSLSHAGIGLVVLGITASISWEREVITMMQPGEMRSLSGYDITLQDVEAGKGPNYDLIRGTFDVRKGGNAVATLYPEIRRYSDPVAQTTEAAIYPLVSGDLYAVIGESGTKAEKGLWAVRLYHKPLLSWMWAGAFLMVVGGMFSLSDRKLRVGVARPATGSTKAVNLEAAS